MKRILFVVVTLAALVGQPIGVAAQQPTKPTYMQIFYQGTGWLADQPLLHYSPAFRDKTQELVREDSTRAIAPGALVFGAPTLGTVQYGVAESVTTDAGTFVPGSKGKMRPQTPADVQKKQLVEKAQFSRGLTLLNARAALAYSALTKALNEAAADGWEVVQIASTGNGGGLVYLLRRH